jgi:hypothetical protein
MSLKNIKWDDVQSSPVGCFQINRASLSSVHCKKPCTGAHAPRISCFQPWEVESGCGRDEVVAHVSGEVKEIVVEHATNGVGAMVLVVCVATAIPIPSCQGVS